ncbi:MAG: sms [Spirosoma sp.]|nr:sms [Spirosoma sp.]
MANLSIKECVVCSSKFETTDKRKIYCGNSCNQEAFRRRHGLNPPEFLQPGSVKKKKPEIKQKLGQQAPKVWPNPAYADKIAIINSLEGRLDGLRSHKQAILQQEATVLKKNPELLANLTTAALAAGVIVGTVLIGYLISNNTRDKDKSDQGKLIAVIVGLGLATFLALITHESTKAKHIKSKLDKLTQLKAESDRIDNEISSIESELAVHSVELLAIPATIKEEVGESSNEVHTEPSARVTTDTPSVMTATELQGMTFDLLTLNDYYVSLFGRPARGFAMALYGLPGHGKSTFAMELAYDLATANGKGIYISAEEGYSQSLQEKCRSFKTDHLLFSDHSTLVSIKAMLQRTQYDIVVLDSIQQIGISPDELTSLLNENPRTSFIYILQVRKDGEFKGDNRYAHDADIQLRLVKYVPQVDKTRFIK